jgi:exosome complex exonuclease RRP6
MQNISDLTTLQEQIQTALVRATRTTAQIASEDLNFQRTSDANVSEALDDQKARLLGLVTTLLNFASKDSGLHAPNVTDEEGLEDGWRRIVDILDQVLEGADSGLDEFTGIIKRLSPSEQERSSALAKQAPASKFAGIYDVGPSKIPKPQDLFDKQSSSEDSDLFKPLLRSKPHAIIPLEESLVPTKSGQYVDPIYSLHTKYWQWR